MPVKTEAGLASNGGEDAGATLSLPETVAVLPTPSGLDAAGAIAVVRNDAAAQPAAATIPAPAAFAGSTPDAGVQLAAFPAAPTVAAPEAAAGGASHGAIDGLIAKYAALYDVPETLVRHVVKRESTFDPTAYNRGHWGLMQIKHATARGMGYDGPAKGLLDPETNLKYAVKYLRGAWLVAGGDAGRADRLYQTGYYYAAKRKGLLDETGLGRDRHRMKSATSGLIPVAGQIDVPITPVTAPVPAFVSTTPGA